MSELVLDDSASSASPRYFPVARGPFRMTAGLYKLGHDFGNGLKDKLFFQRDRTATQYRAQKEATFKESPERLQLLHTEGTGAFQARAFCWMAQQLEQEHGIRLPWDRGALALENFKHLSLLIQEDFALIQVSGDGTDQLVLISVCFPSGWKPETLLGANFAQIHAPVPEFSALAQKQSQLVSAMTNRGPYVRFVWSLTADRRLDHHPDAYPRDPWSKGSIGYLRVERQITVPFPESRGSVFLIRTYVTPLADLTREQRIVLCEATEALPPSVKAYKGLGPEALEVVRREASR